MPTRPALIIRLTHSGQYADGRPNVSPVQIPDLDVGYERQDRKVPVYVPPGGYIDINASSRSMLSYEQGGILKFTNVGVIDSKMFYIPEAFSTVGLPPATDYPAGTFIWNTTLNTAYWSDGTSWTSGSAAPSGPAGGDLDGTYPNPTVDGIRGVTVQSGVPNNGDALLYNSFTNRWEHAPIVFGGGPPTGPAGGDLTGIYPNPAVDGLLGDALPVSVANGFLKRNAANNGWEEVAYGSAANTVCQGNDVRLSDARPPTGAAGGDLSGTYPNPSVTGLRGRSLSATVPANGQTLLYNSGLNQWEPSLAGDTTAFVFQPGGTAGKNIFTSWAILTAALSTYDGPVNIVIDDSFAAATIPVGVWDLDYRATLISHNTNISPPTVLTLPDGAVLRNLAAIRGQINVVFQGTTAPNLQFNGSPAFTVAEGVQIQNSGTQPVLRLSTPGQLMSLGFYQGSQFTSPGGGALVDLAVAGVGAILFTGFFTQFSVPGVVTGVAGTNLTFLYDDSLQGYPTNPAFLGTTTAFGYSNSALVAYDDNLVAPPLLGSSNVQGAIDALKGFIPVGGGVLGSYNMVPTAVNYTAAPWDIVLVTTTAGKVTITLPLAASCPGKPINVKKVSADGNVMEIDAQGAELIDGAANLQVTGQYNCSTLVSDGSNWWII